MVLRKNRGMRYAGFILCMALLPLIAGARPAGSPYDTIMVMPEAGPEIGSMDVNQSNSFNPLFRTSLYFSGAAAITVGMIRYDQQIYTVLHNWRARSSTLSDISPVVTNLGDGTFSLGVFSGYLGYGFLLDNAKAREVGKIGLESFAVSGLVVQLMKYVFGREQPNVATHAGGKWNGLFSYFRGNAGRSRGFASFDSFPSGHTTTIFAAATTLADMYDEPWVTYTSYSVASVVAISRVMERTHWMSDCFVGALIGYFSTRAVEKFNSLPPSLTIEPAQFHMTYGVKLILAI